MEKHISVWHGASPGMVHTWSSDWKRVIVIIIIIIIIVVMVRQYMLCKATASAGHVPGFGPTHTQLLLPKHDPPSLESGLPETADPQGTGPHDTEIRHLWGL